MISALTALTVSLLSPDPYRADLNALDRAARGKTKTTKELRTHERRHITNDNMNSTNDE